MNTIINRFKNQRVSQLIHLRNRQKDSPPDRVENCHRLKAKHSHSVSLRKKEGAKKAHYGDLQTCGSVWSCPVCASIISERRCQQVQYSCDIWRKRDCQNSIAMITWTTPHNIKQPLSEVLHIQDRAMRIMKQQPQRNLYPVYRTIVKEMCSVGAYTGRENTFGGKNGWHPHRHDLHFMVRANHSQLIKWRHSLSVAWAVAFLKAGGNIDNFEAFLSRSVRIDQINSDDGYDRISKYITTVEGENWSLAREATKGIIKFGKNGNISPFGMLEAIRHGDDHSRLYSAKFWEYAQTMKGKKQFFPTPGLSKFLGVEDKTDAELLKESCIGDHYAFLTHHQWSDINHLEIKGEVLAITEHLNEFEFMDELDKLIQAYQADKAA